MRHNSLAEIGISAFDADFAKCQERRALLPGLPLAFKVARAQLDAQEQAFRDIDSRSALLLAGLVTFGTFYLSAVSGLVVAIVSVPLIVTLLLSIVAFVPTARERTPNPEWVLEEADQQPDEIKARAMKFMLQTYRWNERSLRLKALLLTSALIIGTLTMSGAIVAKGYQAMLHSSHDNGSNLQPCEGRPHGN